MPSWTHMLNDISTFDYLFKCICLCFRFGVFFFFFSLSTEITAPTQNLLRESKFLFHWLHTHIHVQRLAMGITVETQLAEHMLCFKPRLANKPMKIPAKALLWSLHKSLQSNAFVNNLNPNVSEFETKLPLCDDGAAIFFLFLLLYSNYPFRSFGSITL